MTRGQVREKVHKLVDHWIDILPENGLFNVSLYSQESEPDLDSRKFDEKTRNIELIHLAEITCETRKKRIYDGGEE